MELENVNPKDDDASPAERAVLEGETPRNFLQKQMQLAEKLYEKEIIEKEKLDFTLKEFMRKTSGRNLVMHYWANSGYSEAFRKVLTHPQFKDHPRLNNDFHNITLADLHYYREHQKLLE